MWNQVSKSGSKFLTFYTSILILIFRKSTRRVNTQTDKINKTSIANMSQISNNNGQIPFSKTEADVKFPVKDFINK